MKLGAKLDLLDDHVRLNLAGYIMDRKGTQTDFDNVDTGRPAGRVPNPTFNLHTEETRNAPGRFEDPGPRGRADRPAGRQSDVGRVLCLYSHAGAADAEPVPSTTRCSRFTLSSPRAMPRPAPSTIELPVDGLGASLRFHLDANYADPQYSFQSEPVKTDSSFIVNGRIALADIPSHQRRTTATFSVWTPQPVQRDAHLPPVGGQRRDPGRLCQFQSAPHVRRGSGDQVLTLCKPLSRKRERATRACGRERGEGAVVPSQALTLPPLRGGPLPLPRAGEGLKSGVDRLLVQLARRFPG